jgi:hypothetical protein
MASRVGLSPRQPSFPGKVVPARGCGHSATKRVVRQSGLLGQAMDGICRTQHRVSPMNEMLRSSIDGAKSQTTRVWFLSMMRYRWSATRWQRELRNNAKRLKSSRWRVSLASIPGLQVTTTAPRLQIARPITHPHVVTFTERVRVWILSPQGRCCRAYGFCKVVCAVGPRETDWFDCRRGEFRAQATFGPCAESKAASRRGIRSCEGHRECQRRLAKFRRRQSQGCDRPRHSIRQGRSPQ